MADLLTDLSGRQFTGNRESKSTTEIFTTHLERYI
jgi:hypothetical protein